MSRNGRPGTQSIERAVLVLRELATRGKFGWTPKDLSLRCGLDRSTVQRTLACLARERLAEQRNSDRHYFPGPLLFELALANPAWSEFQAAGSLSAQRLSKRFETLAIFYLRSGEDVVCAACTGKDIYAGSGVEVGSRRPLVSAAGGVAILIALSPAETRDILAKNLNRMKHLGEPTLKGYERMVRKSQSLGYALNQGDITKGASSIAVPVRHPEGEAFASLTVSGYADGPPATRKDEVVDALKRESALLEGLAGQIFAR